MLTTSLDGLWVLQAAAGIEQLCPELGLRPLLPRVDTKERALQHPIAEELISIGAMDADGQVNAMIREWMIVIARRDVALMVWIGSPGGERGFGSRISLCRFAQWWVTLERYGDQVRLSPAGMAHDESGAGDLVVGQIEKLCGVAEAASLRPVTLPTDELLASVRDGASLRQFLTDQRLDVEQRKLLMVAADTEQSSQANIVAIQAGAGPDDQARLAFGECAVTIADTPSGRLCIENVYSGGDRYQVVVPGTRKAIGEAVVKLIRRLPAGEDWYSYRRVV
jgi:hypothetical protein